MWMPRAATSVATRTWICPLFTLRRARSRWAWVRSPCRGTAEMPRSSSWRARRSAPCLVRVKMIARSYSAMMSAVILGALVARHAPEVVVHVAGRLFAHDVVNDGVVGEFLDERLDVGTHGGREQHDVAVAWRGAHDASNGGQEAHVGHAVGFVDDHRRDVREVEGTLFEHVLEAAGARDDDVDAEVECLARHVVRRATVDADDAATAVVGQVGEFLLDLRGEFAGGHEDEAEGLARTSLAQARHQGKSEREGLSRAGDGLSDDVATGEGVGERGLLDGEGFGDAASSETLHQVRRHAEVGKGHGHMTPTS